MTVCDSLVSSKLCGFVLEHLLNSLVFSRIILFAQMKIWGRIWWGKTVLTEPFADYFHLYQNTRCTCSFWMLSALPDPHLLGIFRKYSGGWREAVAFFCMGSFCLQVQAEGRNSVTNLCLLWFLWGDVFGFVGILNDLKANFFFNHLLFILHGKNILRG